MARRKMNKIEPAVQTMTFTNLIIPGGAGASSDYYIDLSQCASLANRRFYRQGLNWAVAGMKFLSSSGASAIVQVQKLPNTWVLSNSWEKSMRAWLRMNNEAMSESESVRPRFMDFKIYADLEHHQAGFAANLVPFAHNLGEWDPSVFQIPDSTSATGLANGREIIAVGANYPGPGASGLDAVSMIEGYAASRALPDIQDPNVPTDFHYADGPIPQNWLQATFNEGTEQIGEVLDDLSGANRIAPYPFEGDPTNIDTMYPGGANNAAGLQLHDQEYITPTTIGGTTRLKGGNFPCGLLKISGVNLGAESVGLTLQLDLVPGNHRGYLCEPMTEM